jgi:phage tail protein X
MANDSRTNNVRELDRATLRVPGKTLAAIDAARAARPGVVSRNTWLTEAIAEKLAREHDASAPIEGRRHA